MQTPLGGPSSVPSLLYIASQLTSPEHLVTYPAASPTRATRFDDLLGRGVLGDGVGLHPDDFATGDLVLGSVPERCESDNEAHAQCMGCEADSIGSPTEENCFPRSMTRLNKT